jgi:hypothetical protein
MDPIFDQACTKSARRLLDTSIFRTAVNQQAESPTSMHVSAISRQVGVI